MCKDKKSETVIQGVATENQRSVQSNKQAPSKNKPARKKESGAGESESKTKVPPVTDD